tara:strand:+ start:54 stop:605 length:552 start_codon:yes stop_codon:yes gene_type:complete
MYENKIVGTGTEHPEQLLANPNNWRIHPKEQQDALESLLDDVGWVQNIIVNQRTGHVVDGHMRAAVAISRNETEVPVVYVDLTDDEERKVLASLDPIGAMAVTDSDAILNLIEDLDLSDQLMNTINQSMPQWNPTWDEVEKEASELTPTNHFTLTLEIPFEEFDVVKSEIQLFIQQWQNVRMK